MLNLVILQLELPVLLLNAVDDPIVPEELYVHPMKLVGKFPKGSDFPI